MKLFSTEPRRWLFAFTHPDDEISICAFMRRLVRAESEVWAGWSVTNPIREAEARTAMASIGVPDEHLFFGGFPDQGACERLPQLVEFWANAIGKAKPERIASGAFECGHIDHDSTNFALHHANTAALPHLEIPFYHTYLTRMPVMNRFASDDGQEVLHLEKDEWEFKRDFSRMYPSQNIASLLVWYTLLGWVKCSPPALCRTERMRLQTHFDYLTPNLPPRLANRVIKSETWKRWARQVEQYRG